MFRDARVTCPSCDGALIEAGSRGPCEQYGGAMVSCAALDDMFRAMTPDNPRPFLLRLDAGGS